MILFKPIVVEPSELEETKGRHRKGTKKKRRTTSSTSSTSKCDNISKKSLELTSSVEEYDRHAEEIFTRKENISKDNLIDETNGNDRNNHKGKKGKNDKVYAIQNSLKI